MSAAGSLQDPPETQVAKQPSALALPFLGELEGLRALAALAVMLTHVGFLSGATGRHILPGLLARLDIGVAVFFVLSGFLLFRPHVRTLLDGVRRQTTASYAARRIARLMPALILCLVGTLVLVPASRTAGPAAWAANVLQVQAWRAEWDLPGLAQLWSLSTEVAFYLLLPVFGWALSLLVRRRPRRVVMALVGVALLGWLLRALYHLSMLPSDFHWSRTFPLMLDWFAWGMLLAVVAHAGSRLRVVHEILHRSGTACLVMAAAIFWFLTTWAAGPYDLTPPQAWQDWVKHLGYGAVAALVVMPSALGSATPLSALLRSRVVTFLGRISYGIFLWHLPLIFWVRNTLGLEWFTGGFWLTLIPALIATIAVATVSWYVVERPIIDMVRRRTRSSRG